MGSNVFGWCIGAYGMVYLYRRLIVYSLISLSFFLCWLLGGKLSNFGVCVVCEMKKWRRRDEMVIRPANWLLGMMRG